MAVIMLRLDKYLAEMGVGTRSEVKDFIRKGLVTVDGRPAKKPEEKIDGETQSVSFRGEVIGYAAFEYYMLNKPQGVVSATEDRSDRTVVELIRTKRRKDLFPVGRLDKDTEGLLLITNDGALAHGLLSPKKHIDKTYYAKVAGRVTQDDIDRFAEGLDIGEKHPTLPATLRILASGELSEIELTIREGKFHQVKRMFEAVGKKVLYLKRLSMGSLKLDASLPPGAYRELTEQELTQLKQMREY